MKSGQAFFVLGGSFIYVAVADLIPGLHARTALRDSVHQVSLMVLGLVYGLDSALH